MNQPFEEHDLRAIDDKDGSGVSPDAHESVVVDPTKNGCTYLIKKNVAKSVNLATTTDFLLFPDLQYL